MNSGTEMSCLKTDTDVTSCYVRGPTWQVVGGAENRKSV